MKKVVDNVEVHAFTCDGTSIFVGKDGTEFISLLQYTETDLMDLEHCLRWIRAERTACHREQGRQEDLDRLESPAL